MFRGHGVGQVLLTTAELLCLEESNKTLHLNYYDNLSSYDTITSLLKTLGWKELAIDHNYYRIKICDIHKSFIGRHNIIAKLNTNKGIHIKDYSQITQADWSSAKRYIERIPRVLQPIRNSHNLVKELTLFFYHHERLIGWLTTTMRSIEELCVENIYADAGWRHNGLGITMMGELYERLKIYKNEHSIRYISFFTDNNDISVKRLYNLIFKDVIDKTINHHMWEKTL